MPPIALVAPVARLRGRALLVAIACSLLLGGCQSGNPNAYFPGPPPPVAPASTPETVEPPEVTTIVDVAAPILGQDILDAEQTNGPAATNLVKSGSLSVARWGRGWVPFERVAREIGIGAPQRTIVGNSSRYTFPTRNGVFAVTMGSRITRLNGLNVWLGFPPQVVQGEPCFHGLDIEKTLQPLAEVTAISASTKTIVLDPGHGGADAGTRAPRGEREKDYTLDWALRTERLLTNAGWRVVMTRRTDVDLPLPDRVALAERAGADLFISLHFNSAAPHAGPSGIETYCLTPVGMPSTLVRGFPDDVRQVHPNNVFDRQNVQLAAKVHRELIAETHALDNGIRRARFMGVLRNQSRPAVLIEGGYLSNPAEFTQIHSAAYRQRLAEAVARSLQ